MLELLESISILKYVQFAIIVLPLNVTVICQEDPVKETLSIVAQASVFKKAREKYGEAGLFIMILCMRISLFAIKRKPLKSV